MISDYSELMILVNKNTAIQLSKQRFSFVRLVVRFSGDCVAEYGYNDQCIVVSQTVPYSVMGMLSKRLARTPHIETAQTTIGGMIVSYQLMITPKDSLFYSN
jgi:hypothetical protein